MKKRTNRGQARIGTVPEPRLPIASFRDDFPGNDLGGYSDSDASNTTPSSPVEPPPLRSLRDQLQLRLRSKTRTLIESISDMKFDGVRQILDEMVEYLLDLAELQELH